jgi:ABC-2 type transport system permease protein
MIKLLKIEWMKIKNYNAFIVISSFFVLSIFAANYLAYYFKKNVIDPSDPTGLLSSGSPFGFPKVWQTVSYYSGLMLLLPGLLLLILVTNEFTYRTHRQNIIDGISRIRFTQVKLLMGFITALVSTGLVFLAALLFGFAVNSGSFSFSGIENIAYFFLKALTYNFIAILIGVLIRRTGFAIAVYFIYTVLENGISLLLYVWAIKMKKDQNIDLGNMGNYLPMNASDGLLYSPFSSFTNLANKILPADYTWLVLSLAIIYLALFYFWTQRRMIKSDL